MTPTLSGLTLAPEASVAVGKTQSSPIPLPPVRSQSSPS
jgi:hypothetical protein